MNNLFNLSETINKDGFKYNKEAPPVYNYLLFQQAISFERGVEFLSSSNDNAGPILYLVRVPELDLDLKKSEMILRKFNENIINQVFNIMTNEKDLFKIYRSYFDLYNAVELQQMEYTLGSEQYFGRVQVREYPHKRIKDLKIPILRSHYRGIFLNAITGTSDPIKFEKLGADLKNHLSSLYLLKRRYNMKLQKELNDLKNILFYQKRESRYYRYKGDISDLIETAVLIVRKGKVDSMTKDDASLNAFCKEYCNFLGVPFTKLSNYLTTLYKKKTEGRLFLKNAQKSVEEYLETK